MPRKKGRRSYICPLSKNKKEVNKVTKSGRNNVSEDVISSYTFSSVKPLLLFIMSLLNIYNNLFSLLCGCKKKGLKIIIKTW